MGAFIVTCLLVLFYLLGIVVTVYMVGKPRQPMGATGATATVILQVLVIAGTLYLAAT